MTNLSETEIQEIETRCEAATPGPWELTGHDHYASFDVVRGPSFDVRYVWFATDITPEEARQRANDGAFIAHAREDIPALLSTVRELQRQVQERDKELETERLRLAACGVAAIGYFTDCKEEYRSASLDDVLRFKKRADERDSRIKAKREEIAAEVRSYDAQTSVQNSWRADRQRMLDWLDGLLEGGTHG